MDRVVVNVHGIEFVFGEQQHFVIAHRHRHDLRRELRPRVHVFRVHVLWISAIRISRGRPGSGHFVFIDIVLSDAIRLVFEGIAQCDLVFVVIATPDRNTADQRIERVTVVLLTAY